MKLVELKRTNPNNPVIKKYADAIRKGEKEMADNHETLEEMAQRIKEESHREDPQEEIPYDQPECDDELREKNW